MNHAKNRRMNRMELQWFFFGYLGIGTSNESLVLANESSLNRVTKKWIGLNTSLRPTFLAFWAHYCSVCHVVKGQHCSSGKSRSLERVKPLNPLPSPWAMLSEGKIAEQVVTGNWSLPGKWLLPGGRRWALKLKPEMLASFQPTNRAFRGIYQKSLL